ncbi:DUF2919 family protein [Thalassotalea ganghwensis]
MNVKQRYANFQPKDFDRFDCIKISPIIYLALMIILRAYIVWLVSVTNFNDRTAIISWLYPEPNTFYSNLLSGSIGLFILLVLSLRRPSASHWVVISWRKIRELLVFAMCIDWLILVSFYLLYEQGQFSLLVGHVFVVGLVVIRLYQSQRVAINIDEFPQPIPEK